MVALVFQSSKTGNLFAKPFKSVRSAARARAGLRASGKITGYKAYDSMSKALRLVKNQATRYKY